MQCGEGCLHHQTINSGDEVNLTNCWVPLLISHTCCFIKAQSSSDYRAVTDVTRGWGCTSGYSTLLPMCATWVPPPAPKEDIWSIISRIFSPSSSSWATFAPSHFLQLSWLLSVYQQGFCNHTVKCLVILRELSSDRVLSRLSWAAASLQSCLLLFPVASPSFLSSPPPILPFLFSPSVLFFLSFLIFETRTFHLS